MAGERQYVQAIDDVRRVAAIACQRELLAKLSVETGKLGVAARCARARTTPGATPGAQGGVDHGLQAQPVTLVAPGKIGRVHRSPAMYRAYPSSSSGRARDAPPTAATICASSSARSTVRRRVRAAKATIACCSLALSGTGG